MGILKVGVISAIIMREAISASKVPEYKQSDQSTFRIPLGIPVTVPEDYSDNNASGSANANTTTGDAKLSDDEQNDLLKDESMFGEMTPEQKQQQLEGEVTKYAPSSCILTFNLNEIWIKRGKYGDL